MRATEQVLSEGSKELSDIAPGMLKKKVAAFIFLPWLNQYTQRVRQAAQEEERRGILAIPNLSEDVRREIQARGE